MHLERVLQVEAESGLDFISSLNEPVLDPSIPDAPSFTHDPHTGTEHSAGSSTGQGQLLGLHGIDPIISRYGRLQPGDMVDFLGSSCSGKTLFLYAIVIATILPRTWKHSKSQPPLVLAGRSRSVLFIDMDQGFCVHRLKSLLCLHIVDALKTSTDLESESDPEQDKSPPQDSDAESGPRPTEGPAVDFDLNSPRMQSKIDTLALQCMRNVHIFRPQDAISALVLLRTMDQYLAQHSAAPATSHASSKKYQSAQPNNPPFALLLIDSLSSFYWQEQALMTHRRFMTMLVDAIDRLLPRWKLVVVTTSWSLASTSSSDRTTTDPLRARFKYRFLMQPRDLDRFATEAALLSEWRTRQKRERQSRTGSGVDHLVESDLVSSTEHDAGQSMSLFQAQMTIPPSPQPERFRFSISSLEGFHSFSVPTL
ncbi:hypothetical protein KVV02_008181 [Mortierella alpina]|uniref:DNA recombination and repair protein Rad51-like C-terminal domain-containing protein n=1 Tax=Mortierella alpina TaxID=64518 RepID=A0A9P8CVG0_MORAP|nr:hypothetical protein KVV02_008181 [Mortierella alpina]